MSDAVAIARKGIPVVTLITDRFWEQSRLVAETSDMPDLPRVMIPYPLAGSGDANLLRAACDIAGVALAALELDTAL